MLFFKNDKESLRKYQDVLKDAAFFKTTVNQSDYVKIALLSLEQVIN